MDSHPSVSDASFSRTNLILMQNPFPSENQAVSMPDKDFLISVISRGQPSQEKLAGALFQTMGVTDKERHKASGIGHRVRSWRIAQVRLTHPRLRFEARIQKSEVGDQRMAEVKLMALS